MPTAFSKRTFLNKEKNLSASIVAHIELDKWKDVKDKEYIDIPATLQISDCHRTINLDFNVHSTDTKQHAKNQLEKARKLQAVITAFADSLEKIINDVNSIKK